MKLFLKKLQTAHTQNNFKYLSGYETRITFTEVSRVPIYTFSIGTYVPRSLFLTFVFINTLM